MEAGDVRTVGVVGCGLMGSGIVEVVARSGIDAIYLEPTAELVEAGRGRVERSTAKAVERGKLEAEDRDAILGRVRGTVDAGDLAGVDLVIEAATEDPAVKIETFRRLDEMVHFLEQIYGRKVEMDDTVTVVRFSQISDRPSEIQERMRPSAPAQN